MIIKLTIRGGKVMKKIFSIFLILVMVTSLMVGCSKTEDTRVDNSKETQKAEVKSDSSSKDESSKEVVLNIPHYKAGQNVGGKFFLPQVERFNKKYEGMYEVVIDEIPQDSYMEKIKQLAQQNKLPALIEGAEKEWFEKVIIANDRYYDLSNFIDSNPDLKDLLVVDSMMYNAVGSSIVSMPLTVVRPIGLYYNDDMLDVEGGIGSLSIDEFTTLLEGQEQKIAFMTAENAWTTSLFFTAIVAEQENGLDMIKTGVMNPVTDYTTDLWVNSFTKLQYYLQNLASSNTLGAAYADAANSFMSESAAVIANGPWMTGDFAPEASDKWSNDFNGDKVKGDIYPGNVAIASTDGYGWWIPSGLPEDETEAALAFLEFINSPEELEAYMLAEGGIAPFLTPSQEYLDELANNRILSELSNAVNRDTIFTPMATAVMPASVSNEEFGKLLPKLIDGTYTPMEFAEKLSEKAVEAME